MRRNLTIACVLVFVTIFAARSNAQEVSIGIADLPNRDAQVVEANIPAGTARNLFVLETNLGARTRSACMASRNFANAMPADPDSFRLEYQAQSNSFDFRFVVEQVDSPRCRAVLLRGDFDNDGDVDGRDFLIWQTPSSIGRAKRLSITLIGIPSSLP